MFFKKLCAALLALTLVLTLAACGSKQTKLLEENNVMFTLDGGEYEVTRDYFQYYLLAYRDSLDNGDLSYWENNDETGAKVIAGSVDYYMQTYALIKWAKELGIEFGETELAQLDSVISGYVSQYGSEEAYETALNSAYATAEVYRRMLGETIVINELSSAIYAEDSEYSAVTDAEYEEYIASAPLYAAKHILIKNDEGEDAEENRALAEELLERIKNGEDFDALMNEYSEDTGLANYPDGYVFGEGEMVESFETATAALAINEVSGIVESDYGYHIIKRIPLERSAVEERMVDERVQTKLSEVTDGITIEYADGFDKLAVTDFFWPYGEESK